MEQQNFARRIVGILDKKHWKPTYQVAHELDTISPKVLPVLHFGLQSVITYNGSGWKLKKKAKPEDIEMFLQLAEEGVKADPSDLSKYYKPKKKLNLKKTKKLRTTSRLNLKSRNEVDSIDEAIGQTVGIAKHGFAYGKKKLYDGPQGKYWTDPNFKKKEW